VRIKRFIAPDMRTALRMVRDEQGADAVILSNRTTAEGIEVVAATDYDEALVAQALRAAAPGLETINAAAVGSQPPPPANDSGACASIAAHLAAASATATNASVHGPSHAPVRAGATPSTIAIAQHVTAATSARMPASVPAPVRESLAARARAVFRIDDGPTLAELSTAAGAPAAGIPAPPLAVVPGYGDVADAIAPPLTRLEAMMAAMGAHPAPAPMAALVAAPPAAAAITAPATIAQPGPAATTITFAAALAAATITSDDWASADDDYRVSLGSVAMPVAPLDEAAIAVADFEPETAAVATPTLHAIAASGERPDTSMLAMREELASMRQLIERQMGQLSLERLRGSPARAAAYEALLGYGCEDALAQAVAAKIDPRLPPAEIQAPMFAELARMLTVARSEPLDDGGVIALVGPTGAGKTTTVAKLAARFAARHRARDVALVTTDSERAGAHEQLHAHGRRLGITVCEASGPEGLQGALAQLSDYPLVLVDTTGYAPRDRALFGQILWLRAARKVRSLLVLPANAHPHDLGEVIRRYRPAAPEAVVLTKLDETGRLGSALSVAVRHGLTLAYTTHGQQVPSDIDTADATRLARTLEKLRRAADNPLATEDRHAFA